MTSIEPGIISKARRDLAQRLGLNESEVSETGVEQRDYPDAALGASAEDEMSAQIITPGWRILFQAAGESYEYRATQRQLRLVNFKGRNYRV